LRDRNVAASSDGHSVPEIAGQVGCHARTVRSWVHRFNAEGVEGLGDRQRPGRPRRLSENDRSRIVALVKTTPPGRLHCTQADVDDTMHRDAIRAGWMPQCTSMKMGLV
jgi:transposase